MFHLDLGPRGPDPGGPRGEVLRLGVIVRHGVAAGDGGGLVQDVDVVLEHPVRGNSRAQVGDGVLDH